MKDKIAKWQKWARDPSDDSTTPVDMEVVADYIDRLENLQNGVAFSLEYIARETKALADRLLEGPCT